MGVPQIQGSIYVTTFWCFPSVYMVGGWSYLCFSRGYFIIRDLIFVECFQPKEREKKLDHFHSKVGYLISLSFSQRLLLDHCYRYLYAQYPKMSRLIFHFENVSNGSASHHRCSISIPSDYSWTNNHRVKRCVCLAIE